MANPNILSSTSDYIPVQYQKYMLITVVKTAEAVDQERHGINGNGLGQFVTASEAI